MKNTSMPKEKRVGEQQLRLILSGESKESQLTLSYKKNRPKIRKIVLKLLQKTKKNLHMKISKTLHRMNYIT